MTQDQLKRAVAEAALAYVEKDEVLGVGTGSTANFFIDALASIKQHIPAAVASSKATAERLHKLGIEVVDLNSVDNLSVYVDGADEINPYLHMIKGGGGALTREKIVAAVAKKVVCIADSSKQVDVLGNFPLPIEVIPMARSYVARELVKLGGSPVYRQGFVTDNGNVILDVHGLSITEPAELEAAIKPTTVLVSIMWANNETGVVQDIPALATAAKVCGGWFHSDAVQALGKLPLDFRALNLAGVHAITLSAHKAGGPKGAAALVLDKRVELQPLGLPEVTALLDSLALPGLGAAELAATGEGYLLGQARAQSFFNGFFDQSRLNISKPSSSP